MWVFWYSYQFPVFLSYINVKSLYLLKKIGYYYIFNKDSVSRFLDISSYIKCFFIFIKYIYETTNDNKYEKDMISYLIILYIEDIKMIDTLKNNSEFIPICEQIIYQLYNDKFISKGSKKKLRKILNIINKIKR